MKKRVLSFLLALVMAFSLLPGMMTNVYAATYRKHTQVYGQRGSKSVSITYPAYAVDKETGKPLRKHLQG